MTRQWAQSTWTDMMSGQGKHMKNNEKSDGKPVDAEMKFAPHCGGKQQTATFDTVRDHMLEHMQKNYKCGGDIV